MRQNTFGMRLRQFRESKNYDVAMFAEGLGVHRSYIYRLENGTATKPSRQFKNRLVTLYDLNMNWLETGRGEMLLPTADISKLHRRQMNLGRAMLKLSDDELSQGVSYLADLTVKAPPLLRKLLTGVMADIIDDLRSRQLQEDAGLRSHRGAPIPDE